MRSVNPKKTPIKDKEPVEVFCRLRPSTNVSDSVVVQKTDNTSIRLCPPNGSQLFYRFKHVFDEKTSQLEVFEKMALPLVSDLFSGKSGLLFTYGITCSGKTFTIVGKPSEPGIVPRCLDILFSTLNTHNLQSDKYVFRPDGSNYFEIQSSADALLQREREQKTIPKTQRSTNGEEWDKRLRNESFVESINCENRFAVFVSYVEIYNNFIYDLFDENSRQKQSKVLREDNRKRVFVSSGAEIEVKSADEAFQLFIRGVRRRRTARTKLNRESSRSHSVFTIRVVQTPKDDPFLVTAQLSIVDLAGSERTVRTENTGDRLREASNINNSLMALRNCMETLRENQMNGANKVVPYRDHKLTHLFKSYFEGEGRVQMIICVNPCVEDYDETLHVMKFAEHSQQVLVSTAVNTTTNDYQTLPESVERGFDYQKKISDLEQHLKAIERQLDLKTRELSDSELEKQRFKAKMKERLHSERLRLKDIFADANGGVETRVFRGEVIPSSGNERCTDHRPLELGTVLRPKIKNKKSVFLTIFSKQFWSKRQNRVRNFLRTTP